MSTIKKTTLHPEGSTEVDLYPKTNIEQVEGLEQALTTISQDIIKAEPVEVQIFAPKGAKAGNITQPQLVTLLDNKLNYINMVNDGELYTLNDNGHIEGFLTYSHLGIENNQQIIKTLTITISTLSFVIVMKEVYYRNYSHAISLRIRNNENVIGYLTGKIISTNNESYNLAQLTDVFVKNVLICPEVHKGLTRGVEVYHTDTLALGHGVVIPSTSGAGVFVYYYSTGYPLSNAYSYLSGNAIDVYEDIVTPL